MVNSKVAGNRKVTYSSFDGGRTCVNLLIAKEEGSGPFSAVSSERVTPINKRGEFKFVIMSATSRFKTHFSA